MKRKEGAEVEREKIKKKLRQYYTVWLLSLPTVASDRFLLREGNCKLQASSGRPSQNARNERARERKANAEMSHNGPGHWNTRVIAGIANCSV